MMLAGTLGNAICARGGVSPLSPEECQAMGEAIAELAMVYNVQMDPRLEAWLTFGGALFVIVGPRVAQAQANRARRAAAPPPKVEPEAMAEPEPAPPPAAELDKDAAAFHGPA